MFESYQQILIQIVSHIRIMFWRFSVPFSLLSGSRLEVLVMSHIPNTQPQTKNRTQIVNFLDLLKNFFFNLFFVLFVNLLATMPGTRDLSYLSRYLT